MDYQIAWTPQPGPQTALLQCPLPDVFYGGARGGGKTDGLLGVFLAQAGRYGAHARGILFRRTIGELDEVIARSQEIYYRVGATYNVQKHEWRFPNGAFLRLRYLDVDADARFYQGHSYTFVGFDEITHWPSPEPIDKLWACLRSPHGVPCVRRSTGNPGGPGHVWVKERYRIDRPLQPFWFPLVDGDGNPIRDVRGEPLKIHTVFIPSLLDDNPLLMKNDPMYEARIASAGSAELFKAWRYGNWDVLAGQYFDIWNPREHTVEPELAAPPPWATCWMSGDWGFNDKTVILWHWMDENSRIYTYRELCFSGKTPAEIGELITASTPKSEKVTLFPFSPDAFHKRTSPKSVSEIIFDSMDKERLPMPYRADDDRIGGWQLMYQLLKSGQWKVSKNCPELIRSIPMLIRDADRAGGDPNDIADSPVDHAPDAARYGLKTYVAQSRQAVEEQVRKKLVEIPDETSRVIAWMQENAKARWKTIDWRRPRRFVG